MTLMRAIGIALAAAGIVFLVIGISATDSPVEQVSETFTGKYTSQTLWYIAGGLGAIVGGGLVAMASRR